MPTQNRNRNLQVSVVRRGINVKRMGNHGLMWACHTSKNYNGSNELVLGTLSLCDFRVKILTVKPELHLNKLSFPSP